MGTYAFISFACFGMNTSYSPGWRPAFQYFNSFTALAGGVLCVGIMMLINPLYAAVALLLGIGIGYYVFIKKPDVDWGTAFESRAFWKANQAALALHTSRAHNAKVFQPSFLIMSGIYMYMSMRVFSKFCKKKRKKIAFFFFFIHTTNNEL